MMQQPHVFAKMQEKSTIVAHVLEEIVRIANDMSQLLQHIAAKNRVMKFVRAADYRSDLQRLATALNRQATVLMTDLGLSTDAHVKQLRDYATLQLVMLEDMADKSDAMRAQLEQLADGMQGSSAQVDRMVVLLERVLQQQGIGQQDVAGLVQDLEQEKQRMAAVKNQAEAAYLEQIIHLISLAEQQGSQASTSASGGAGPSSQPSRAPAPPPYYLCPISQDIMVDPVLLLDSGHTYERAAIERWLSRKSTDPLTGAALQSKLVAPNHTLRKAIQDWCARHNVPQGTPAPAVNAGSTFACPPPAGAADAPPPVPFWGPLPAMQAGGRMTSAPSSQQHTHLQVISVATAEELSAAVQKPNGTQGAVERTVDLGGHTLNVPSSLEVARSQVTIRNGKLVLAAGSTVHIAAPSVTLQDVAVEGEPPAASAPIFKRAAQLESVNELDLPLGLVGITGTDALLQGCSVAMLPTKQQGSGSDAAAPWICVHVLAGGSARLLHCTLSSASNDGLSVGFAGRAHVEHTTSSNNKADGFCAAGTSARLVVDAGCTSNNNGQAGYHAADQGKITVGEGCAAHSNKCGFLASGESSHLVVGQGCSASNNQLAGFYACDKAKLDVGNNCVAEASHNCGFMAASGGKATVGEGCMASGGLYGFYSGGSDESSHLVVGQGCSATNNQQCGFIADIGRVDVGDRCVAEANGCIGFVAQRGGKVFVGEGCVAMGNKDDGFFATSKPSLLVVGRAYTAKDNGGYGFLVEDGGRLDLGADCSAKGNKKGDFKASFFSKLNRCPK